MKLLERLENMPKLQKRRFLLVLFLFTGLLSLNACGAAPKPVPSLAPTSTPAPTFLPVEGTILAMGDSLTEGLGVAPAEAYPARLAEKLAAEGYNFEVINAGVSGETSSGACSRLDWVMNTESDIVILVTGGNDGLRGIDPALTEKNITEIVEAFQADDRIVILGGMQTIQNLGQPYTDDFAAIYPSVAEAKDLILIPFFLDGVAAVPDLNQEDGIHPTAEGYEIIVDNIYPYVLEAIEQVRAKNNGTE